MGEPVVDMLIDGMARSRAEGLRALPHNLPAQGETLPETYIIRYYMPLASDIANMREHFSVFTHGGGVRQSEHGHLTRQVPMLSQSNPLLAVDSQQRGVIEATFANITAQMPGRFRFERVDDAGQADLMFGAAASGNGAGGAANRPNGAVVLVRGNTNGRITTHEILHALGLDHPMISEVGETRAQHNDRATYFDTAMTYDENNNAGKGPRLFPHGLMPADMGALARLYPVADDVRRGARLTGLATGMSEGEDATHMRASVVQRRPDGQHLYGVAFPKAGLAYMPIGDTADDHVILQHSARVLSVDAHGRFDAMPQAVVRVLPAGLFIDTGQGVGSVMPVVPERLDLSIDVTEVEIRGNIAVHSTGTLQHAQLIRASGTGNQIVGSPSAMVLQLQIGTEVDFSFTDTFGDFPNISLRLETGQHPRGALQASWVNTGEGQYRIELRSRHDEAPLASIGVRLPESTPQAHAWLQQAMGSMDITVFGHGGSVRVPVRSQGEQLRSPMLAWAEESTQLRPVIDALHRSDTIMGLKVGPQVPDEYRAPLWRPGRSMPAAPVIPTLEGLATYATEQPHTYTAPDHGLRGAVQVPDEDPVPPWWSVMSSHVQSAITAHYAVEQPDEQAEPDHGLKGGAKGARSVGPSP